MSSESEVLRDVEQNGVQLFFDEIAEPETTRAFTLGLWHLRQRPEVVAFGLPEELAGRVLELVADDVEEGVTYQVGQQHEGIVHGYPVTFGKVSAAQVRALLPELVEAYGSDDVPVLQLVYPDRQGRWPWDPDVREGFCEAQPVLERLDG